VLGGKRAFSRQVGYSWIDTLKEVVAREVSMRIGECEIQVLYKHPLKGGILYRSIFLQSIFPSDAAALCVYHKSVAL
jgi:asparagine synthase (glutamine-hydrolysing)